MFTLWPPKNVEAGLAHRLPVPIRYVFVPCRVIGLGLHPNIRIKFELNRVITGIGVNFAALIVQMVKC